MSAFLSKIMSRFLSFDWAGNGGISLQIVSKYGESSVSFLWEQLKAKNEERRVGN